jgi:eukaryotic-like serine/threonine-protein kinase
MTSNRWEQIKGIFDAAVEQLESGRDVFVSSACRGDGELEATLRDLLAAHDRAGSFLEKPAPTPASLQQPSTQTNQTLSAGSVVSQRFRILRFLGEGGMGQVYEALDTELECRVALKTIRPDISADQRVLSRFKQEVQLTRRITHPNVCRMFDIQRHVPADGDGIESGFTFLTMELLAGETLADMLRRCSRLSPAEALPLVLQMIEALSAAHHAGIVHRDFKPGNVMLVPTNSSVRVVVTDFGLARAVLPDGQTSAAQVSRTMTGNAGPIGTLVYMAPEQLERGEATPASDIYALGLVMYEMVTGQRPFADPIPFAEASKRTKQAAPSPKILVPDLDPAWEGAIGRCLEAEPGARPQSVRLVGEEIALGGGLKELRASLGRDSRSRSVSRGRVDIPGDRRRRNLATGATLLMVAMALFAAALRYYGWKATVPDGTSILLTEVANQTSDQELEATTDVLLHELSQSGHFSVIERSKIRAVLQQMARPYQQQLDPATAREVAWRAGGALVAYATVSRLGPALSLDLRLERLGKQPKDSPQSWYKSFQANDKQDLFGAIRAGSQWIREMAGESADLFAKEKPPQDTTTSSWEALLLYSQAEQLKALENAPEAIERLRQAVQVDPEFALAWMRLGDLSNSIERGADAITFWEKALDVMKLHPLTKKEDLRIRGLYASDTGDYPTARRVFQEWEVLYPKDYLPSFYLAGALSSAGRCDEAIDKLNEAERKQPNAWYIPAHRARCNLVLGKYDRVAPDLKRLRELGQNETVELLQGALDFVHGDYGSAQGHFTTLSNSPDGYWKSLSYSVIASFFGEMGQYAEARALLVKGIGFDTAQGRSGALADKGIELAYLSFRTGDRTGCKDSSLAAVEKEHGIGHLQAAASMLARCGFPNEAERLERHLATMPEAPAFQIMRHRIEGEIALAKGNTGGALTEFQAEAGLEGPETPKEYLARALLSAGRQDEALKRYREIVESPGQIWQEPDVEPPGIWTDALFQEGRLNSALRRSDGDLRQYLKVRQYSDSTFEEPKIARDLLRQLGGLQVLQSNQQ